jgi:hypothetical protein
VRMVAICLSFGGRFDFDGLWLLRSCMLFELQKKKQSFLVPEASVHDACSAELYWLAEWVSERSDEFLCTD